MEAIYSTFEDAEEILLKEEENILRIIFTRHGRTHLNAERRFQPWTPEGDQLNPEGVTSARDLDSAAAMTGTRRPPSVPTARPTLT